MGLVVFGVSGLLLLFDGVRGLSVPGVICVWVWVVDVASCAEAANGAKNAITATSAVEKFFITKRSTRDLAQIGTLSKNS